MGLSSSKYCELCQKNNVEKAFSGVKLCSTCKSDIVKLVEGDKEICRKYADARNFPNATANAKKEIIDMAAQRLSGKKILKPEITGKCKLCGASTHEKRAKVSSDGKILFCNACYKKFNKRLEYMPETLFAFQKWNHKWYNDESSDDNTLPCLSFECRTSADVDAFFEYLQYNEQKLLPSFSADKIYEFDKTTIRVDSQKGLFTLCRSRSKRHVDDIVMVFDIRNVETFGVFTRRTKTLEDIYEEVLPLNDEDYTLLDMIKPEKEYVRTDIHVHNEGAWCYIKLSMPKIEGWFHIDSTIPALFGSKTEEDRMIDVYMFNKDFYYYCFKLKKMPLRIPAYHTKPLDDSLNEQLELTRVCLWKKDMPLHQMTSLQLAEYNLNELVPVDATSREKLSFLEKYIEMVPILQPIKPNYIYKWGGAGAPTINIDDVFSRIIENTNRLDALASTTRVSESNEEANTYTLNLPQNRPTPDNQLHSTWIQPGLGKEMSPSNKRQMQKGFCVQCERLIEKAKFPEDKRIGRVLCKRCVEKRNQKVDQMDRNDRGVYNRYLSYLYDVSAELYNIMYQNPSKHMDVKAHWEKIVRKYKKAPVDMASLKMLRKKPKKIPKEKRTELIKSVKKCAKYSYDVGFIYSENFQTFVDSEDVFAVAYINISPKRKRNKSLFSQYGCLLFSTDLYTPILPIMVETSDISAYLRKCFCQLKALPFEISEMKQYMDMLIQNTSRVTKEDILHITEKAKMANIFTDTCTKWRLEGVIHLLYNNGYYYGNKDSSYYFLKEDRLFIKLLQKYGSSDELSKTASGVISQTRGLSPLTEEEKKQLEVDKFKTEKKEQHQMKKNIRRKRRKIIGFFVGLIQIGLLIIGITSQRIEFTLISVVLAWFSYLVAGCLSKSFLSLFYIREIGMSWKEAILDSKVFGFLSEIVYSIIDFSLGDLVGLVFGGVFLGIPYMLFRALVCVIKIVLKSTLSPVFLLIHNFEWYYWM